MSETLPGPESIRRYLARREWQEEEIAGQKGWRFTHEPSGAELELPRSEDFADYPRRVNEALGVLCSVEERPVSALLVSMTLPDFDMVRFRLTGDDVSHGAVTLDTALRLRDQRRKLLLSAAHSADHPQGHFPRLSRARPIEFIQRCRELPSERGSYVSSVLVPAAPSVGTQEQPVSFDRRVTETLARAVTLTNDLLQRNRDSELLDHTSEGISANLLEALAGLAPPDDGGILEIAFQWSGAPSSDVPARPVRFSQPMFPPMRSAASALRQQSPVHGVELEGYIARLKRAPEDPDAPGEVTMVTVDDDGTQTKVKFQLPGQIYQEAAEAHANAQLINVSGTLVKRGRTYYLENAGGFARHQDEEEGD